MTHQQFCFSKSAVSDWGSVRNLSFLYFQLIKSSKATSFSSCNPTSLKGENGKGSWYEKYSVIQHHLFLNIIFEKAVEDKPICLWLNPHTHSHTHTHTHTHTHAVLSMANIIATQFQCLSWGFSLFCFFIYIFLVSAIFYLKKRKKESEIPQSYLTLGDPMDCSPPGSSIHGIF